MQTVNEVRLLPRPLSPAALRRDQDGPRLRRIGPPKAASQGVARATATAGREEPQDPSRESPAAASVGFSVSRARFLLRHSRRLRREIGQAGRRNSGLVGSHEIRRESAGRDLTFIFFTLPKV